MQPQGGTILAGQGVRIQYSEREKWRSAKSKFAPLIRKQTHNKKLMNQRRFRLIFLALSVMILVVGAKISHNLGDPSDQSVRKLPGIRDGGKILLPNQWSLHPAGTQILIGDLPLNMQFSPDGRYLAITHGGYGANEIVVVEVPKNEKDREKMVSRVTVDNLWYGLVFRPDGSKLYAAGGKDDIIYEFDFIEGYLSHRRDIDVYEYGRTILPAGMAISSDGDKLYTANNRDHSVGIIDLTQNTPRMEFIALPAESYPYTCLLSPDEKILYVSLWGRSQVAEIDLSSRTVGRFIETDSHPNEMLIAKDGSRLIVSNANKNTISVIETKNGRVLETLCSALYPGAPEGSTPNSLAFSENEDYLLVANADNNNLSIFTLEKESPIRGGGFIPVGWYPTSVRVHPKSNKIYVANGKGQSSKSNRLGPNPNQPFISTTEYIAGLFIGTLEAIDWPDKAKLAELTQIAYECSPFLAQNQISNPPEKENPIPRKLGELSPIKYCVYIIKENRTYDQVFGDIQKGNGDSALCLFPEKVTPNHHAIVEEFVLLDNFYADAEVSADGHEWSMGAYATDFVEKIWPNEYGHQGRWSLGYPSEGSFTIAQPSAGYIWDKCAEHGISYLSYGEFINNGETPNVPGTAAVKSLEGHFDPYFRSFDMTYSDLDRAKRFIDELQQFEKKGELPKFIVMRLPNDHTAGAKPDYLTPTAYVGENDLALGMVIEALSQSPFSKQMAIFVVEDDAQNGPDHVDAHRTVAMVISPYCKRNSVDSHMYSTSSMLRTMELILGLEPMSQFDAAALPMYACFTMNPDFTSYHCRPAQVDIHQKNSTQAWGAQISKTMNLEVEDAADDILFNEIIWKNVRGVHSNMPAPRRAAFISPIKNRS
jgi:DNA-binding beta-propeller fold protein YncE